MNSFQVPLTVKIASVVATGFAIGTTIERKIFMYEAPSIRADSTSASGILLIYSVQRYTPIGSPIPIYGIKTPSFVSYKPTWFITINNGIIIDWSVIKIPTIYEP